MDDAAQAGVSTTSAAALNQRDIRCPICLGDPMRWPRFYECGHTVCTECHRRWDSRINDQTATHSMAVYSCPICRAPTMEPWYHRGLNRHMQALLPPSDGSGDDNEDPARREQRMTRRCVVQEARETDLSARAFDRFSDLAIRMYHKVLPRLYEAASAGQMRIEIDDPTIVGSFQHCYRGVAQLLFENNNVYRFNCLPTEVVILLCPEGQTMTRTMTNRTYRAPRLLTRSASSAASALASAAARVGPPSPIGPTRVLPVATSTTADGESTDRLRSRIALLRSRIGGRRRSSPPPPPPSATMLARVPPPLRLPSLLRPSEVLAAAAPPPAVALHAPPARDTTTEATGSSSLDP